MSHAKPNNLQELRASGWVSKTVKQEIRDNFLRMLAVGDELFPGILGYDSTVIPEINIAIIAGHDMLFLGEKGQGKSRLMRTLVRFLDDEIPYIAHPEAPLHDDPFRPITRVCRELVANVPASEVPIGWWPRSERYVERLAPGTKFADVIGEIDPAKLVGGVSMSAEAALHFGLIPRMHRGIFAMNELPELDELVQVGLFNILEERDVQIRGYPVKFDIDVLILFSANPATYNRSGKVIPQLKDRIGSVIHTHYPRERDLGIEILEQESVIELGEPFPVIVPRFMKEIIEELSIAARKSKYIDQASGVSARFSIANYRTMIASAPSARSTPRRASRCAAHQRPRPFVFVVARQVRVGSDGQPSNVRTPNPRRTAGRSDPHRLRGIRRATWPRRDFADLRSRGEDRSWRHAAVELLRRTSEARPARVGQSLRAERFDRSSRASLLRRIRPRRFVRHGSCFTIPNAREHSV